MLHKDIAVRKSKINGNGLMAIVPIKKGEVVWKNSTKRKSYSNSEYMRWPKSKQEFFDLYAYQIGKDAWVGPVNGKVNDKAQYMNHSCNPNSWFCGDNILVARRDIKRGEEITYDYETSEAYPYPSMTCRCGSTNCRKKISWDSYKKKSFQRIYRNHVLKHIKNKWKNL